MRARIEIYRDPATKKYGLLIPFERRCSNDGITSDMYGPFETRKEARQTRRFIRRLMASAEIREAGVAGKEEK